MVLELTISSIYRQLRLVISPISSTISVISGLYRHYWYRAKISVLGDISNIDSYEGLTVLAKDEYIPFYVKKVRMELTITMELTKVFEHGNQNFTLYVNFQFL